MSLWLARKGPGAAPLGTVTGVIPGSRTTALAEQMLLRATNQLSQLSLGLTGVPREGRVHLSPFPVEMGTERNSSQRGWRC